MKAAVLHGINDLRIQDVTKPVPNQGEELIKVSACGICSSDIARITKNGTYYFPTIPGHEYAGKDERGKLFAVYPLLPCYQCEQCRRQQYQCCTNYNYTGSRCDGGFAEYVKVPRRNLILVPSGVSAKEAAMTEPAAVGMHAARKAEIKQGESVVIIGCGTIGLITAQIVRAMGASKIFLVDVSEERLDIARSMGFPNVYNSKKNLAETLGACADVVIEMVGLSVTYNLALDLAKGCGRVVWTGNIADDLVVPKQRVSSILRKELSILGTWNSTAIGSEPTDWQMVLQLQSQGKIKLTSLISHQILLDELPDMIQRMVKEKDLAGSKIIVNMD